jgi:hypothetical protein
MPSFRRRQVGRATRVGAAAVLAIAVAVTPVAAKRGRTPDEAQAAQSPQPATSANFTIYLRTNPIGSETVSVARTLEGWTITSSGRSDVPLDVTTRKLELHYSPDWKPLDFSLDATLRGQSLQAYTTVQGTVARNVVTRGGQTAEQSDTIASDAVILPVSMWGPFEALAQRLQTAPAGSSISAYALGTSYPIQVGASTDETLQMGARRIHAKRTAITLAPSGSTLAAEVWGEDNGRLMRISIPAQNLEIVRDDISSVAVRRVIFSRPGDQDIKIPANGFRLTGTLSKPSTPAKESPLVVLVGGASPTDRDENLYGVPIFGHLSNALADAGFMVVRYDKRAIGQSGGRAESATLDDYTDDLLAVVKTARGLPGVDKKRVAVIGHSEGGLVAMLGAARDRGIAALVLLETMGTTGADLNLWQVNHSLERSARSPAEKAATVDLQKRIQAAVLTGTGWDKISREYRQADTPWFKSFLTFDPARTMSRISQPLLIVHGLLDTQVPSSSADQLEALAKSRKNNKGVEVAKIPGVNHVLAQAVTGEPEEYATLKDKQVSPAVSAAVTDFLKRTFAARR